MQTMKSQISISRVTGNNQQQLDDLCRLRDNLSAHHDDFSTSERFRNFLLKHMGEETMLVFLMDNAEKAIGYGMAFDVEEHAYMPEWSRRGYVTQFYVDSSYRGQGIGELGLNYIHAWFRSRGLNDAMLNVAIDNEAGNKFWVKQGYVPYATRMKYVLPEE
jgi:GNAT superfamily N-acetyltransferase